MANVEEDRGNPADQLPTLPELTPPSAKADRMAVKSIVCGITGLVTYVILVAVHLTSITFTFDFIDQLENWEKGSIYAFGLLLGGASGIVAIVLGFRSLTNAGRSYGRLRGRRTMARTGIGLGSLVLSLFALIVVYMLILVSSGPPPT